MAEEPGKETLEEIQRLLEKNESSLKKHNILLKNAESIYKTNLTTQQEIRDAIQKANELEADGITKLDIKQKKIQNLLEFHKIIRNDAEDNNKLVKRDIELATAKLKIIEQFPGIKDDEIIKTLQEIENLESAVEKNDELLARHDKRYKKLLKINAATVTSRSHIIGVGKAFGLASNVNKTWLGRMNQTFVDVDGIGSVIKKYPAQIKETFSPANIFAGLMNKVVESTSFWVIKTDSALASMNKATGAGGRFNKQIIQTGENNLEFGVGLLESAQAFEALHAKMSIFTSANSIAQLKAAETTAKLMGLGISAETTAQTFDVLTRAMGMSVGQADEFINTMASFSDKIGVAPSQLMNDFVATAPLLVAHGPRMSSVFKDLAKQSKATGIGMQSLIGIAQQFDTFEGASQAAGKLNAILGGNLVNSIQLLNVDEATRIKLLREGVRASGRSFESMSRFEKMAVANAAGIKDMNEAARLFGKSDIEFRKIQREQKTLQQRAEASADIMKKLTLITQSFATFIGPIINSLHWMAQGFLNLNKTAQGFLSWILIGGSLIGIFALKLLGLAASIGVLPAPIEKVSEAAGKGLAGAVKSVGTAGLQAGPGLASLGAGLFTIAGSIALVVASIALATFSISMLIDSVGKFFNIIIANMDKLSELASSLGALTAVMLQMLVVGAGIGFVALAFGVFTAGVVALAAALSLIKTDDLLALSEIAKSLDGMTIEKSIALRTSMQGFETAVVTANSITPETIKNTSRLVEKVNILQQAALAVTGARTVASSPQAGVSNAGTTASSPSVGTGTTSAASSVGISGPLSSNQKEVVLKLNERELGRAVVNILENQISLNKIGAS